MLEEPLYFARLGINVHLSEGGVRAGARHQADGSGAGAEEFGSGINQHVADRQGPAFGDSLPSWFMGKA